MLRSTVTRFQIIAVLSLLALSVMLWLHSVAGCVIILVAFISAVGLGVALPQFRFFGPFVCSGNVCRRCVALTFDDGPDASSTPALLDLLREARLSAAFFCVGKRVETNPELSARIAQEGHLLGNHSFHHHNLTNLFSFTRLLSEMTRTQAAIEKATGVAPIFYRPPIGHSNPRVFRAARSLGLSVMGWTAGGLDTQLTVPERIVRRIVKRLRPGAIILLHDGNIPSERLVATVKLLLDTLRALDYEVIRLDELLR